MQSKTEEPVVKWVALVLLQAVPLKMDSNFLRHVHATIHRLTKVPMMKAAVDADPAALGPATGIRPRRWDPVLAPAAEWLVAALTPDPSKWI
mgnify:CR=1 FL=1